MSNRSYRRDMDDSTKIRFLTTGGTIDKIYFDAKSEFTVGDSLIAQILSEGKVNVDYEIIPLMRKDSLELTDEDRQIIFDAVSSSGGEQFIVTHGTDTMTKTAEKLSSLDGKTVVLTGALTPARFRTTDAVFNLGMAVAAVQTQEHGVYIAMSGQIFAAGEVRKNVEEQRFERI